MVHKYFKITNKYDNHHGYQYKSGLNIVRNFDEKSQKSGFYFADRKNIHHFYDMGNFISPIILPRKDFDFKIIPETLSWRSNKIILGEKYSLAKIDTYQKFNIPLPTLTQILYFEYYDLILSENMIDNENYFIQCMEKNIPSVVEKFINNGVNLSIGNNYPLRWSLQNEYWKITKTLIENRVECSKEKDSILLLAVKNDDLKMVIKFISHGAHIDQSKALIIASEKGYLNIVKFLIDRGANVNVENGLPLIRSSKNGHFNVVKFLIEKGANIHARDGEAYKQSYINKHYDIARFLEKRNGNHFHQVPILSHIF